MEENSRASMQLDWRHTVARSFSNIVRSIAKNLQHRFGDGIFLVNVVDDSDFYLARFLRRSDFICKSASLKIFKIYL